MTLKQLAYVGVCVGSTIGSAIPMIWGADIFSFSSILFGGAGAITGIYVAYKFNQW